MIINNELTEYSIVRVNRHLCNNMQGKKVVVILELEVVQPGSEVTIFLPSYRRKRKCLTRVCLEVL